MAGAGAGVVLDGIGVDVVAGRLGDGSVVAGRGVVVDGAGSAVRSMVGSGDLSCQRSSPVSVRVAVSVPELVSISTRVPASPAARVVRVGPRMVTGAVGRAPAMRSVMLSGSVTVDKRTVH